MFLTKIELRSTIYSYQLTQITQDDDSIIDMGIEAAITEVKSYLQSNDKKHWQDGRPRYDADAIFAATGSSRNALLLELTKTVAQWWIIRLCNADILHEQAKDRYDRAIAYLKKLASGENSIASLPLLPAATHTDADGNTIPTLPFRAGGRKKFNHD
jgi:hypothetical protein